jgi:uncharacterized protein
MRPQTRRRTLQLLRARRGEILRVAAEYGASNVRVFGSVARGEDDDKSDVDILVDLPAQEAEGGFAYFGRLEDLKRAFAELLGRNVDVLTTGALVEKGFTTKSQAKMRQRVLAEAVPI